MEIKQYLANIIYISVFGIILELFLPKTKLKKYVSSVISLIVLFSIISPVFNIFTNSNIEKALDNAIYALSNNSNITTNTNSFDFEDYKTKIILSRTKLALEQELLQKFSESLKEFTTVTDVIISLNNEYKIEEVLVYISHGDLNTIKLMLDKLVKEYNIPNSALKIIERGV